MVCQHCGNVSEEKTNFCIVCGAKNIISPTQYPNITAPSGQPPQEGAYQPHAAPSYPNQQWSKGNQGQSGYYAPAQPINPQGQYSGYVDPPANPHGQPSPYPQQYTDPNSNGAMDNQGYYDPSAVPYIPGQAEQYHLPAVTSPPPPQPVYVGPYIQPTAKSNKTRNVIIAIVIGVVALAIVAAVLILGNGSTLGKNARNRTIGVVLATDDRGNSYLVNADGTSIKMATGGQRVVYSYPISDPSILAFLVAPDYSSREYSSTEEYSTAIIIVNGEKIIELKGGNAVFSEDGKSMVYSEAGSRHSIIYKYNIKTETATEIASVKDTVANLTASPDLNIIYYTNTKTSDQVNPDVYKIVGSNEPVLMDSNEIPSYVTNKGDYISLLYDLKRMEAELIININGKSTSITKYKNDAYIYNLYSSDLFYYTNKDFSEVLYYDNGVYLYSTKTGKSEFISDYLNHLFQNGQIIDISRRISSINSFRDTDLIYITEDGFSRFDSKGKINDIDDYYNQIRVTDSHVFFIDRRHNLVRYDISTAKTEIIGEDVQFMNVSLDGKTVVYSTNDSAGYVYRNNNSELLQKEDVDWIDLSDDGSIIFMYDYYEDALFAYKDKNNIKELGTDLYNSPVIVGNSVFFDEGDDSLMVSVNGEASTSVLRRLESFSPTGREDIFKAYMSE